MKQGRGKLYPLALCGLFAALTAIGAFLKIPMPPPMVPLTLQFQFCALAGIILGSKYGAISQLIYVLIGLAGFPIFTKGGGIQYVFVPSFGYLLAFILAAFLIGRLMQNKEYTVKNLFFSSIAGLLCVYIIGVAYLFWICNFVLGAASSIGLWTAIYVGALVCAPGDIIACLLVCILASKLVPILKKEGLLV